MKNKKNKKNEKNEKNEKNLNQIEIAGTTDDPDAPGTANRSQIQVRVRRRRPHRRDGNSDGAIVPHPGAPIPAVHQPGDGRSVINGGSGGGGGGILFGRASGSGATVGGGPRPGAALRQIVRNQ